MTWSLNHSFVGLPCERGVPLRRRRLRARRERRTQPCPRRLGVGVAGSVRDGVTSMLLRHGLDCSPVGDDGSWLWCLGGPDLYRLPLPAGYEEYADSCLDLNVWVCEEHEVITADLFPYDVVPESGGSSMQDPRRSTPIPLGDDVTGAASEALTRVEHWLDDIILMLPKR